MFKKYFYNFLMVLSFCFYIIFLIFVLFLYARKTTDSRILFSLSNIGDFWQYIKASSNFTPFQTIKLFLNGYAKGYVSLKILVYNIFGNFVLFMPLGIFIHFFLDTKKHFFRHFITVLFIVLSVELLQIMLMVGRFDIDDIILNISGEMAFYSVFRVCNKNSD